MPLGTGVPARASVVVEPVAETAAPQHLSWIGGFAGFLVSGVGVLVGAGAERGPRRPAFALWPGAVSRWVRRKWSERRLKELGFVALSEWRRDTTNVVAVVRLLPLVSIARLVEERLREIGVKRDCLRRASLIKVACGENSEEFVVAFPVLQGGHVTGSVVVVSEIAGLLSGSVVEAVVEALRGDAFKGWAPWSVTCPVVWLHMGSLGEGSVAGGRQRVLFVSAEETGHWLVQGEVPDAVAVVLGGTFNGQVAKREVER